MSERRIYIVRHAIAEDFAASGRDEDRALTPEGRKKMKRAARGLVALGIAPARLLSSPLVRAQQTSVVLVEGYPQVEIETCDLLAPGVDEHALTRLLNGRYAGADVMLVGHEPDLGELLSFWRGRDALQEGRGRVHRGEHLAAGRQGGSRVADDCGPASCGRILTLSPASVGFPMRSRQLGG
jgi:phosphohistidine phosphatase